MEELMRNIRPELELRLRRQICIWQSWVNARDYIDRQLKEKQRQLKNLRVVTGYESH